MDADFAQALSRCLDQIPRGRVATCGAIARALGDVRAARSVATWLAERPDTPRCHRVVRADGRPVLAGASARLAEERVCLERGRVDAARILGRLRGVDFLNRLRDEQVRLAAQVKEADDPGPIELVTGVDVAYDGDEMNAVAVSIEVRDLEAAEIAVVRGRVEFPYIPTYLAYREFPGIEAVVSRLSRRPDALMIDGHGRLHPALFGVACHTGLRLDMRTIGIAKHPLAGNVGSASHGEDNAFPIEIEGKTRGYAWTPPGRAHPIYVSVGHRISLGSALDLIRRTTRHAYPEALRIADRISKEIKRNEKREKGATR